MKRKTLNTAQRMQVYEKCKGHCAYCGTPIAYKQMQVDHVVPMEFSHIVAAEGGDPNHPEPAAILEGVDCERSKPRPFPGCGPRELPKSASREEKPAPQMKVRRVLAAEGEAARYRFEAGVVQINTSGQKRASLALYLDECRQMMRELAEFLDQIEEVQI